MNNILIDTCYWFALYDTSDGNHNKALDMITYLELGKIIIPFPTLYETINTRFIKRGEWIKDFEKKLNHNNFYLIKDKEYQDDALNLTFDTVIKQNRFLSLTDMVIRLMLNDINLKIDYLITFDTGDFIDMCQRRRIELINE